MCMCRSGWGHRSSSDAHGWRQRCLSIFYEACSPASKWLSAICCCGGFFGKQLLLRWLQITASARFPHVSMFMRLTLRWCIRQQSSLQHGLGFTALWPRRCCLSQIIHPSFQSLRSPLKLRLPKGGCVCENTHLSPADGSFPGHTVPPARLPSRAWPSPQPAQQAPGITSPCWQDPFYGLSVHNTSSNAGQYPAFPWPCSPHQPVIYLLWQCKNTLCWLFLPFICWVSNMSWQLSNTELGKWDRTVWWCWNGQLAWHFFCHASWYKDE